MVAMVKTISSRERLATCLKSVKIAADLPSKLEQLHLLKENLLSQDLVFLSEFLPDVFELQSDRFSPIRKLVAEIIGEIGLKNRDLLPQIVPILISITSDGTPAVARQAIMCGIYLFRYCLERTAIEGLYSCELDSSLQSLWECMSKFKEKMYAIAFQGDGGMRLLALKFVVAIILLYTPDPNGLSEPPSREGSFVEFNISWLRGGHPLLNIGDLSIEASQSLGLLLDQLRFPAVQTANNSLIILLIKSLSEIAEKRPAFYGRILPVLLDMDPSVAAHNGAHALGVKHALKNAYFRCLKCTHSSATPWHSRLNVALREMNSVGLGDVCKINGNAEGQDGVAVPKDEKLIIKEFDVGRKKTGRKRPEEEGLKDPDESADEYRKRMRSTPSNSEELNMELDKNNDLLHDIKPSIEPPSGSDSDISGPVQQLVAMFGALVGQGEKAIESLQILIASISADLLAEVVIANMRYLPPSRPDEGDGELLQNMNVVGSDSQVKYPSSFVADVLSLSSSFPAIASMLDAPPAISFEMKTEGKDDIVVAAVDHSVVSSELSHGSENAELPCHLAATFSESDPTSDILKSESHNVRPGISFDILDLGSLESEIPGLVSPVHNDRMSEFPGISLTSNNTEDDNLENDLKPGVGSSLITPLSILAQRSEEFSPGASVTDHIMSAPSTATSMPAQLILPKMSAPVIDLAEEQKDNLQRLAFIRIVDAYKQIVVAGGLEARSSVLAYLGVEYPLELEPWKVLQRHILADHITHEGHELTLRVLYRLFGVAEVENDFFSSTTAASVYETFFLTIAEALRDTLPPSDKSLSRLLGDAPFLPNVILDLLESMCSPGNDEVVDKEFQNGDRVTQGLSAVWNLILSRPSIRDVCLKIALKSAVHHSEEVRMKAIRLVANKLYPLTFIAQKIEKFSEEMVLSVTCDSPIEVAGSEKSVPGSMKDSALEKPSNESPTTCSLSKDITSDAHQLSTSSTVSPLSISEAQRRMSLFFALCTKKHSLFRQIFVLYKSTSAAVKETIHHHIPILVRTMGLSSDLLDIIADPPPGSKDLLMQVLHTLTDGTVPSHELVTTLRKLYNSKLKDVDIIIPVLPFLPKEEVMMFFPQIVNLAGDNFQTAFTRLLQGSNHNSPMLSPAEVLIAIHGIDPDRDGIPLKKVTDACNACFEQRQIFTQQVIAKVLNQLVEQIPLPLLFMRTVLQAIGAFPPLVDFILDILSRLVSKQIWKYPKLWVGFLKCAQLTKPRSFSVLLQLPSVQLENALNKTPALKPPLVAHANQPDVRSTLPRSVLAVLGIGVDSQTSQSQVGDTQTTSQSQVGDTSNSEEAITEKS